MKRPGFALLLAFLLPDLLANTALAATVEQLAAEDFVTEVKISPGGSYLVVRILTDGSYTLRFIDRKTFKVVGGFGFSSSRVEVGDFAWINDERLAVQVNEDLVGEDKPDSHGELYAMNVDGSQREAIFGMSAHEMQTGSHIKKKSADPAWGKVIDVLPEYPDHVLVSSWPRLTRADNRPRRPTAVRIDHKTGVAEGDTKLARHEGATFHVGPGGEIRLVMSRSPEGAIDLQVLPKGQETWVDSSASQLGDTFQPVAVTDDLEWAYALDTASSDLTGLHKLRLDGAEYNQIYANDKVDVTSVIAGTDGRSAYGIRVDDGYPSYLTFLPSHPEAETFKQLLGAFTGNLVSIRSRTSDGRYWIARAGTDIMAGRYYLFDSEAGALTPLFDTREGLAVEELSPMQPIAFASFDGQEIAGYLTPASNGKKDKLVVLVHDGPHDRDYWGFNPTVQVLATRGYSVLQVNYRGSAGYGQRFRALGAGKWSSDVQKDIAAGASWAIEQGYADAGKICIMGTGFGGYSAVLGAIQHSDLYACAVANDGFYDLDRIDGRDDRQAFGLDDSALKDAAGATSPLASAASVRVPLMIAYSDGNRVTGAHADDFGEALSKQKKKADVHEVENRVAYLNRALKFLDSHL